MKIGIRTFHYGANHGAFLQAYGLMQACAQFGESSVADYANPSAIRAERQVLFPCFRPRIWLRYRQIMRSFAKVRPALSFTESDLSLDAVVCGSDEIWNVNNSVTGYDPFYFGALDGNAKRISYAPSVGSSTAKDLLALPGVGDALRGFNALSVRDSHSQRVLLEAFGLDAEIVPDPVFLYDFPEEVKMPEYEGCILVYASSMGDKFAEGLAALKKKTGAKVVSLFYPAQGADVHLNSVTPFQALSLFRHAHCVVTTTFHGTMLSLRAGTPFMVKLVPEKAFKIEHWLNVFGVQHRAFSDSSQLSELYELEWDPVAIERQFLEQRSIGLEFLAKALA